MEKIVLTNPSGHSSIVVATFSKEITVPAGAPYIQSDPFFLYIGSGGNLKCKLINNSEYVEFKNIPDGTIFPGIIKEISEDSTVDDLVIIG